MSTISPPIHTPQRTLRWARVCNYADSIARRPEKTLAIEFCREERDKATAEGYDDTAAYLQHIIDDLIR
jgi:hypothetical protein